MKLIIGLGNPGLKYQTTWHNLGFVVIDALKTQNNFSAFKKSEKLKALVTEGSLGKEKAILAKPITFMNNSGQAVEALAHYYKIPVEDIWVIHDEIDLPLGKIRISQNASAAGHNGIKSIIDSLGSKNFVRFRIGIKPESLGKISTEKYVLQKVSRSSNMAVKTAVEQTAQAIETVSSQGLNSAMSQFN